VAQVGEDVLEELLGDRLRRGELLALDAPPGCAAASSAAARTA
jgi:hypothetical protein